MDSSSNANTYAGTVPNVIADTYDIMDTTLIDNNVNPTLNIDLDANANSTLNFNIKIKKDRYHQKAKHYQPLKVLWLTHWSIPAAVSLTAGQPA